MSSASPSIAGTLARTQACAMQDNDHPRVESTLPCYRHLVTQHLFMQVQLALSVNFWTKCWTKVGGFERIAIACQGKISTCWSTALDSACTTYVERPAFAHCHGNQTSM
eukprot:1499-Amphidinium_carterae.1